MCIKPQDFGVGVHLLQARDRADGLRVVTAEDDGVVALPQGVVGLVSESDRRSEHILDVLGIGFLIGVAIGLLEVRARIADLDLLILDEALAAMGQILEPALALEPGGGELDSALALTTCEGIAENLDLSDASHFEDCF